MYCTGCNKPLPFEKRNNKFCGCSCAAKVNNAGRCKNPQGCNGHPRRLTPGPCPVCGGDVPRGAKYCCSDCYKVGQWKERVALIEATGVAPELNENHQRKVMRRYLIEKYGHRCSVCGGRKWRGAPIPLVVDHIDGDQSNRAVANYRMVCPNCDAQSPTYCGRNKGNGPSRDWRYCKTDPRTHRVNSPRGREDQVPAS